MELLGLLGVLLAIALLASPILALSAYFRSARQREEIELLRTEVAGLRRWLRKLSDEAGRAEATADDAPPPSRGPDARVTGSRAAPVAPAASRARPGTERPPPPPPPPTPPPPPAAAEARVARQPAAERPAAEAPPGDAASAVEEAREDAAGTVDEAREAAAGTAPEAREDAAGTVDEAREAAAGAAAEAPEEAAARAAVDFETLIGSTWLLRVGLGVLAIALALFARGIVPMLPAGAKVAIAYAGAMALFGTGKIFEARLERFARPVMAAGLTFGFFVAFAAHFVPAMSAVGLPVSIAWMVFGMATVLAAAERWESQVTAALALLLGHVSALVSAGSADMYSLVMIAFLAVTAAALVLRHRWAALGLFAVAATYGAHLLWLLADRAPIDGDVGFWLNLAFLTAYYTVFVIVDVLWWRRAEEREDGDEAPAVERVARQIGPANLVVYASLASFAYVATGAGLETIEWFYLTLGAVQGALAWFYWSVRHRDYVFYPAFGTVLWTLGWFAALDALALNLVLAAQALLLLLAAHQTRLLVFHALAQLALVVSFTHYLAFPQPAGSELGLFLGGLGIAAVYLLKSSLEEIWYGDDGGEARLAPDPEGAGLHALEGLLADLLRPVAPFLAPLHAALGGFILARELVGYLAIGRQVAVGLVVAQAVVAGLVAIRRRGALLFAFTALGFAALFVAARSVDPWGTLLVLDGTLVVALLLIHFGDDRARSGFAGEVGAHGQAVAIAVLLGALAALSPLALEAAHYLPALSVPLLILVLQERRVSGGYATAARGGARATGGARREARTSSARDGGAAPAARPDAGPSDSGPSDSGPPGGEPPDAGPPGGAPADGAPADEAPADESPRDAPPDGAPHDGAPHDADTGMSTAALLSGAMCVAAGLLFYGLTIVSLGPVPVVLAWIAGWSAVIALAALGRRSGQLFAAGYGLLVLGYVALLAAPSVWTEALRAPWIGIAVLLVPLAFALGMDRALDERARAAEPAPSVASPMTYLAYALAFFVLVALTETQLPRGWALVAPAAVGLALIALAAGRGLARTVPSVIGLFVGLHLLALASLAEPHTPGPLLVGLLLLSGATLLCERATVWRPSPEMGATARVAARIALVILASWTAMIAIYTSTALGAPWTTAGWSILGVMLMAAGFGLRSAIHRRTALVVLGVSLVRVFLVDTRGLSDAERTIAFLVLGLALVGAAFLYSRFSEELKSWL